MVSLRDVFKIARGAAHLNPPEAPSLSTINCQLSTVQARNDGKGHWLRATRSLETGFPDLKNQPQERVDELGAFEYNDFHKAPPVM